MKHLKDITLEEVYELDIIPDGYEFDKIIYSYTDPDDLDLVGIRINRPYKEGELKFSLIEVNISKTLWISLNSRFTIEQFKTLVKLDYIEL